MHDTVTQTGIAHFLGQADGVAHAVLAVLLIMSVASWYFIGLRLAQGWRRRRRSREFLERFQITPATATEELSEPFGRLAGAAFAVGATTAGNSDKAAVAPAELLTRALRRALTEETARLESGLTLLASVASAAPFVGLFGTVWGIYHALGAISTEGQASLDQVAGPVGEALIMTAFGLSVAIPAVLAYNAFQRGNRLLLVQLEGFAHELFARHVGGVCADAVGHGVRRGF